ncbi:dihydrolipoamide acetyltransferase family protein [Sinomonas sp. JGH33]|uniref:Dihydrolipoamide acetyltransferase component of pyruvate dehydrogenase complex n=1 Tax=Sinomonas terricola TaxID=3110330 RepID=A0ABU5TAW5_9MICC|nr:dihydrolipoamide acetyltransferase family protein [Sinomonas sp. JGH33]MEA5456828.1 dihydrolipoamide acetyltransferase family protein [Sinomonas sp. JGH33]
MPELRMPSLGADMDHGKIVEWLVKPGDTIHRGDLVAVVDTDKTVMDVEAFDDGVVAELLVDVGETVPVGTAIARLEGEGAEAPIELSPRPPAKATRTTAAPAGAEAPAQRVRSSPLARRLAARLGIDLTTVQGTGQQGSVTEADVRRAAPQAPQTPQAPPAAEPSPPAPPVGLVPPQPGGPGAEHRGASRSGSLRSSIAALMARSKATIPHYYLGATLDLAPVMARMLELNAARPVSTRLVPAAFLLKAAALAASEVPDLNGFFVDGAFQPSDHVHLGIAVALRGGGLVAPALHDADTLSVDELMAKLRDLVARARAGRVQRAEMADPTITVTSLGDLGVETVFGVIVPPQVAMVGIGRVVERPWAQNGMLGVRPAVTATLAADHRVSDGLGGGRYLVRLQELLMKPEEL